MSPFGLDDVMRSIRRHPACEICGTPVLSDQPRHVICELVQRGEDRP